MKKTTEFVIQCSALALFMANQVRARRTKLGITQAELASRAGVTVETVARLERVLRGRASANANPSLETMERLASALGCQASDLISDRPSREKPDPIAAMVRLARPDTRRRIAAVVEALLKEDKLSRRAG
jgi:transcriptional regulator with XRE-family HTH domain